MMQITLATSDWHDISGVDVTKGTQIGRDRLTALSSADKPFLSSAKGPGHHSALS
jgi:hypothetical protein